MYPEYAEIKNKQYKIDTNFETALWCFEIIEDETITDYERALAIVYLLFGFIPNENIDLFLLKAKNYLQCGKSDEEHNQEKKDMDFIQDRRYINSSFMSDYHIDLSKEKLHFWQFVELLEGLTEECVLNRVRDLRDYNLNEIKDVKKRDKIKKAQSRVALKNKETVIKLTSNQQKNIENFYKQTGIKRKE